MSQSRLVAIRTRTRIPSLGRLFVNLKKSAFVKNQEDVLLLKLALLSLLHVSTPVSGFLAYCLVNYGLSRTSSPTNSCHCPILNLYSLNMTCILLTTPSERSPRTPVDLFQIHHNSKLEILSTSSQTRTSHVLVTATSPSPQNPPGVL